VGYVDYGRTVTSFHIREEKVLGSEAAYDKTGLDLILFGFGLGALVLFPSPL